MGVFFLSEGLYYFNLFVPMNMRFSLVLKVFIPMLNGGNQTASFLDTCCLMVSLQTTSPKTPQVKEVSVLSF